MGETNEIAELMIDHLYPGETWIITWRPNYIFSESL
jgi:hypothetical protein